MGGGFKAADGAVSLHQKAAVQVQLVDGRLCHLQPRSDEV